jgi:hypothetical protein
MKYKIAIIGGHTLGTPTEIYEILHGKNQVVLIESESKTQTLEITNIIPLSELIGIPLTRKERRKLKRKKH